MIDGRITDSLLVRGASRKIIMRNAIRIYSWFGLALLLILGGCARGGQDLPDIAIDLQIEPHPPRLGPATVTVLIKDAQGQPIPGAAVDIEGNMNHAGMVPVFGQAEEVAPGAYASSLEFTMGGDWFLLVRAELPDGRSLERKIDVPGVDTICGETPVP
jgi:hypothetical protein